MKDGVVEGRCQLFCRGILSLAWKVQNGVRVGEITKYENGKAIHKEHWDSVFDKNERRLVENTKAGLVMTIWYQCENGSDPERQRENKDNTPCEVRVYLGEFDEKMNRHGYGIEFDRETGEKKFQGYWEKDQLLRIVREFDNIKNVMIEYKDNKNTDVWRRFPVYIGEYCYKSGTFLRHGTGYLIDGLSGTAVRESQWENGVEKSGVDLYDGWYLQGMNESIRSILNDEEPKKYQNNPSSPELFVEVQNSKELSLANIEVTDLVIASNCGNDMTALDLSHYRRLQTLKIGNDCFSKVNTFRLSGLKYLQSLKIGTNSFTQQKDSYGVEPLKSFHLSNCEKLQSISIGRYSFSDFAGEFDLQELPSLLSIKIGSLGTESFNFHSASFAIRSISYSELLWCRSSSPCFDYDRQAVFPKFHNYDNRGYDVCPFSKWNRPSRLAVHQFGLGSFLWNHP